MTHSTDRPGTLPDTAAPSILVVDDEPGITETLADLLADEGYHVTTAADGLAARAAIADATAGEEPLDLVLLDVALPGLDGLALCRQLQQDPATRRVPVVLITAVSPEALAPHLAELPDAALLPKPFRLAEVLDAVQQHLPP